MTHASPMTPEEKRKLQEQKEAMNGKVVRKIV